MLVSSLIVAAVEGQPKDWPLPACGRETGGIRGNPWEFVGIRGTGCASARLPYYLLGVSSGREMLNWRGRQPEEWSAVGRTAVAVSAGRRSVRAVLNARRANNQVGRARRRMGAGAHCVAARNVIIAAHSCKAASPQFPSTPATRDRTSYTPFSQPPLRPMALD